jgi:hypothetical protein
MFRVHDLIVPLRPFRVVPRAFSPLMPVLMEQLPLCFDIGGDVQAALERCGFEGLEHQRPHKRIERAPCEGLTPRAAILGRVAATTVAEP